MWEGLRNVSARTINSAASWRVRAIEIEITAGTVGTDSDTHCMYVPTGAGDKVRLEFRLFTSCTGHENECFRLCMVGSKSCSTILQLQTPSSSTCRSVLTKAGPES